MKIVKNSKNVGYAGGNYIGMLYARGELIAILNPDVVVDKNWLDELVKVLIRNSRIGLVTPLILYYNKPLLVNAAGNSVHFTGLSFCRGYKKSVALFNKNETILAPSGAAFLVKREVIKKIGLMKPYFFMDFADIDFAVNAALSGYDCLLVVTSKVFHKFVFKLSPWRLYILERGRYLFLKDILDSKTLSILLLPLFVTEIISFLYAIIKGKEYLVAKIKSLKYFPIKGSRKNTMARRYYNLLRKMTYNVEIYDEMIKNNILRKIIETSLNNIYKLIYKMTLFTISILNL